jgi:altronate dehydratase small subunit
MTNAPKSKITPDGVDAIALHEEDSVATVLRAVAKGEDLVVGCPGKQIRLRALDDIPIYHKVALMDLPAGATVLKHGHWIGRTTTSAATGVLVHIHNLAGRNAGDDR